MRRTLTLAAALLLAAGLQAGGNKSVPTIGKPTGALMGVPAVPPLGLRVPALDVSRLAMPSAYAPLPQLARPDARADARLDARQDARLIDSLSADIPLMAAEDAGGEEQSAHAEAAFARKAGGTSANRAKKEPADAVPPAPPAPPAPPTGDDGGGPNYPHDVVKFRGGEYPSVAFRPNVPIEPLLIQAIDSAKKSIHLSLYEFKLPGVLEALQNARERGVEIKIVLDYASTFPMHDANADYKPRRSKEIWALLREGFDVKILRGTGEYGINHNKFVIVDYGEKQSLAEFGSYNWAWSAETQHYENAIFTTQKTLIKDLMTYWEYLEGLAQPHASAKDHPWPASVPAPPPMKTAHVDFNGVRLPGFLPTPESGQGAETFEDHMVNAISHVEKTLDVSIFALRSTRIVEAIVDLHKRGKKVRVIIDEGQSVSEAFDEYAQHLAFHGVPVRTLAGPDPDSPYPLAQKNHNKFSIFDGKMVETGSANYTKYASIANFENAHFLAGGKYAAAFAFFFEHMWDRAAPFSAPAQAPAIPSDASLESETRKPPRARPAPVPPPAPAPGIGPRQLSFGTEQFPSYAFRPDTPIEPLLTRAIDASQKSVRLALYEFNLEGVLDALRRAKKRGLKIELVVDRSHVYTSGRDHTGQPRMPSAQIQALIAEGFDVLILKGEKSGIMHNKYAIFDAERGGMIVFGSYNWARTAEVNHYENVVFSVDRHDIADYLAYFKYKQSLAEGVDPTRLEEVFSRSAADDVEADDGEDSSVPQAGGFPAPDERTSKRPAPPESTAPLIDFNGEQFHRHYFSPEGGIEQAWIRAIKAAKISIDIAMFAWWSTDIADALLAAKAADPALAIRIVLDAGQGTLAKIGGVPAKTWFLDNGFDIKLLDGPNDDGDPMFEKQHNKMMILDGKLVFTGSFNLSPTAEKYSFENENLLTDPTDVAGFADFFARMFKQAWTPKPKFVPLAPGAKRVAPLGV